MTSFYHFLKNIFGKKKMLQLPYVLGERKKKVHQKSPQLPITSKGA
jgi:hypothetical protein